jgi:hypothetical protein
MKSAKLTNGKKINLKFKGVKSSRLIPNITQWYLLGAAFLWFPWPFGDGLSQNHNEMFLADLS